MTQEPTTHSMNQPVRKTEQEEAMADWLKDNTVLYNKEKKEYQDVDKKDTLMAQ